MGRASMRRGAPPSISMRLFTSAALLLPAVTSFTSFNASDSSQDHHRHHHSAAHYSCGLCESLLSLANDPGRSDEASFLSALRARCDLVGKAGACDLVPEEAALAYFRGKQSRGGSGDGGVLSAFAACQGLGHCEVKEPYEHQMRSGTNMSWDLRVTKGYGPRGYGTLRVSAIVSGNGGQPLPELEAAGSLNFSYRAPFVYRWQDKYLYSTVVDLADTAAVESEAAKSARDRDGSSGAALDAPLSVTLDIGGTSVTVSLPAEGAPARAAVVADPCFSSRYIQCLWKRRFDSFQRTTGFIDALSAAGQPGGGIDTWQVLGDNFYDKAGNLTAIWFDQLGIDAKSKVVSVAMGNHDYWMMGEPKGAASDDDYSNGKMQFYAMDSAFAYSSSSTSSPASSSVFDFSVDPDDPSATDVADRLPAVANAVWYHTVGNLGFIGYSGAYPLDQVTPYLQEACRWMGDQPQLPAATFLVGHWNNGGMGCEQPMDVPDLYDLVAAMPGCDALGSSLRYVMGHTHCNEVTATDVGFMVAGMGMEAFTTPSLCRHGANFGVPVIDTGGGRVRIYYFPLDSEEEYDAAVACFKESGLSNCYGLATVWLDAPYLEQKGA